MIFLLGFVITVALLYYANARSLRPVDKLVSRNGTVLQIDKRLLIYILAFIPLWILISFRDKSVGIDSYGTYYRIFRFLQYGEYATHKNIVNAEMGYVILNKLCLIFNSSYRTILIITATITWFLYYKFIIENSNNSVVSIAVLFASFSYFHAFNGIRQFMAMAIALQGMKYIYERKFLRFLVIVVLAMTFHKSAILLLALYFLYGVRVRVWWVITSVLGSVVVMRMGRGILAKVLGNSNYGKIFQSRAAYSSGFAWTDFFCSTFLLICGLIVLVQEEEIDKKFELNIVLQLMSVIIAVNSNLIPIPYRLLWYTNINTMIYVPQLTEKIKLGTNRLIMKIGIAGMYLLYFSYYWITGVDDVQRYIFWRS